VPQERNRSTGQRFPLFLIAGFGLTFFVPSMFGQSLAPPPPSPCVQASVATYATEGFECSIDGYVLDGFTFSSSETGEATLLSDSDIILTPSTSSSGMLFHFAPASGFFFDVPEDQTAEYIFQYELDPVLPRIQGTSIDTGPNDPVTLIGQFCGNGTVAPYVVGNTTSCSGTDPAGIYPSELEVTGNSQTASGTFPVLVTDLDTQLILDLDGPANVAFFESGVGVNGSDSTVPEPSTALWLVPGVLALAWLRKRSLAKAAAL
jgi:hypothetical protein